MPLTTQEKAMHPSHPTTTRDLKAIMIIVHSDTVKLGYVTSHAPPQSIVV